MFWISKRPVRRPINVVVIDDDPLMRRTMRVLVSRHVSLSLQAEADCASTALETIVSMRPDALFLDIRMPETSGLELLRHLVAPPPVVFMSSFRNHALEAFELEALDYLIKPVAPGRFALTVERLERLFQKECRPSPPAGTDGLSVRYAGETRVLPFSQVAALSADGDFTRVLCLDGSSLMVCRMLGEYDAILPSPPFVRLDRSLIVNLESIVRTDRISRKFSRLWLQGVVNPLELGRTASQRLFGNLVRKGRVLADI